METRYLDEARQGQLHLQYPGDYKQRRVFIELDGVNKLLWVGVAASDGTPMDVYHRLAEHFYLPWMPTASVANYILRCLVPFAEAALAEFDSEWDGHNMVGRWGPALAALEAEIESWNEPPYNTVFIDTVFIDEESGLLVDSDYNEVES
jgi:hypothetical protein